MSIVELDKEVVVALIAAVGGIIVAIIGYVGNRKKSAGVAPKSERDIRIDQKATGNFNTQIGIQVHHEKKDDIQ